MLQVCAVGLYCVIGNLFTCGCYDHNGFSLGMVLFLRGKECDMVKNITVTCVLTNYKLGLALEPYAVLGTGCA